LRIADCGFVEVRSASFIPQSEIRNPQSTFLAMQLIAVWCAHALALLGHALLWTGAVNRLHGMPGPRWVVKLLSVLCVAVFLAVPLAAARWFWTAGLDANLLAATNWLGPYAWACAVLGAVGLIVKPYVESLRDDPTVLVKWTSQVREPKYESKPLAGAFARALGAIPGNEALSLSVDRKRLAIPRLPAELEGLTIAHISDLHMTGRIGVEFYDAATRAVNDLRPDVIFVTGDIVEREACWPWLPETVGKLCAPLGVFFILGNHDLFVDTSRTTELLQDAGLTPLSGRAIRAQWNGVPVLLLGNEQPWRPAADVTGLAPRSASEEEFRLVACHSPDQFSWCCRADADLALAGHTHGGQVQLPILGVVGSPSLHGSRYACGVFRRGATVLHVTRGLGGEAPLRWQCPPEIALLELTRSVPQKTTAKTLPQTMRGQSEG
jgi:predicted MPP superfamily phosphohydrolase